MGRRNAKSSKSSKTTKSTTPTIIITTPTTLIAVNHGIVAPTAKHTCCVCGQLLQWKILGYWYC